MNATWTALTAPWTAPNGFQVIPVTSEEAMASVGQSLHNGLTQGWAREKWAQMCVEGRRQVLLVVNDEGTVSANSFLRANPGPDGGPAQFEALFVRGMGTAVFAAGDSPFDAVAAYVEAVNTRQIDLTAEIAHDRIVQPAPEPQVDNEYAALAAMSPIERATRAAEDLGISPIDALLQGHGALPPAPESVAAAARQEAEVAVWTPLSERFVAANGWVIAPTANSNDVRRLGEELDNMLFDDGSLATAVAASLRGETRYAAIEDDKGVVRGIAQFGVAHGQPILLAARGYCDERPSAEAMEALGRGVDGKPVMGGYLPALYTGGVDVLVGLGANGFSTEAVDFAEALDTASGLSARPLNRIAGASGMPTGSYGGADGADDTFRDGLADDDGGYNDDDLGVDDEHAPFDDSTYVAQPVPEVWTAIAEGWTHLETGMQVMVADNADTLANMGAQFGNALQDPSYRAGIQRRCGSGEAQVIRIMSGDTMVANGMLEVRDGEARFCRNPAGEGDFLFGPGGNANTAKGNLTPNARDAADAWMSALNQGDLELQGRITDRGFEFDAPTATPTTPGR